MSTASALEMNSHTPSDARIREQSDGCSCIDDTSGVATTPQPRAFMSPTAREIARPGHEQLVSRGGNEDPGALDPRALADGGAKSFGWLAGARRAYGSGAMRVLQPKVPSRKAGEGA